MGQAKFCRVRVSQSLDFCEVFSISLCVLSFSAIELSVLRFTASDYPISIFKLSLSCSLWSGFPFYNQSPIDRTHRYRHPRGVPGSFVGGTMGTIINTSALFRGT